MSPRFHRLHFSPPSLMPYISGLDTFAVIYTLHYIHTLPIELRSIWSRRFTGTSVLFLLNRHGFMLSQILNTIGDFPGNIGQLPCVHSISLVTKSWNSCVQKLTTDKYRCTALEFTTASLNVVTSFSTSSVSTSFPERSVTGH